MKRPRRALLFMPGDDLHKIEKATGLEVDSIVMDLEDGVALSQKAEARQVIRGALSSLNFGNREKLVRINPASSPWAAEDVAETVSAHPDGYMIAKTESAEDVQKVSAWLDAAESRQGWEGGSVCLLALVESALGIVNLKEIVTVSPRLEALIFGAEDFASSIGATRSLSEEEVAYGRAAVVTYAKAFGLQAIDTPYIDLHNLEGLAEASRKALHLGYDGKLAIHPKHVPVILQAFIPSASEITHAEALIAAHNAHQQSGAGVFAFEGKMVDMPIIRAAEAILARAGRSSQ